MEALVRSIVPALVGAGIILVLALLTGGSLRGRRAEAKGGCAGCSCQGTCAKSGSGEPGEGSVSG